MDKIPDPLALVEMNNFFDNIAFPLIAIVLCGIFIFIGCLAIFNPMKIINYYSKDNTAFIRRVKTNGLTKRDISQFIATGIAFVVMGIVISIVILFNM
ncbi:MAG: hypothetical protein ACRYFX_31120 [Janthinobacterium lividum]